MIGYSMRPMHRFFVPSNGRASRTPQDSLLRHQRMHCRARARVRSCDQTKLQASRIAPCFLLPASDARRLWALDGTPCEAASPPLRFDPPASHLHMGALRPGGCFGDHTYTLRARARGAALHTIMPDRTSTVAGAQTLPCRHL